MEFIWFVFKCSSNPTIKAMILRYKEEPVNALSVLTAYEYERRTETIHFVWILSVFLLSLSATQYIQYPLLFKVLYLHPSPIPAVHLWKVIFSTTKKYANAKYILKTFASLGFWGSHNYVLGHTSQLDIWRHAKWVILIDWTAENSKGGGRMPFRNIGSYLPTDTASYSGRFWCTNVRIWDPPSGIYIQVFCEVYWEIFIHP
jgi:hypothetical protein